MRWGGRHPRAASHIPTCIIECLNNIITINLAPLGGQRIQSIDNQKLAVTVMYTGPYTVDGGMLDQGQNPTEPAVLYSGCRRSSLPVT